MATRRVGVEIEFAGLAPAETARIVAARYGGELRSVTEDEHEVHTSLGTFKVELDSRPMKKLARDAERSELTRLAADVVGPLAREIVPCEIVTPPLPEDEVHALDGLLGELGERGARGTFDAVRYAFGVHFNPEVTNLDVKPILAHMRAFALLYRWLLEEGEVDPSRRLSPFIDPYPARYVDLLLREAYRPSLDELIDDYLEHTPTRNRALDMLPLFAHIDRARVVAKVEDPLVKARPTYHYRLPNCRVGEPGWRLSHEWDRWTKVELLASDPAALARAMRSAAEVTERDLLDRLKEAIGWA